MTALALLIACAAPRPPATPLDLPSGPEVEVQPLALEGPAARAELEFSGMAWLDEHNLALLPQYPRCGGQADRACLYVLGRDALARALRDGEALRPAELPLDLGDLVERVPGFEGLEALVVDGDRAWVTVEASPRGRMRGLVVPGRYDGRALRLDPAAAWPADPAVQLPNKAVEALVLRAGGVCALDEANGPEAHDAPRAQCFGPEGEPATPLPMAPLSHRLTDATAPDDQGRFWVTNTLYAPAGPVPALDALALEHGVGPTHARASGVERLVELRLTEAGVQASGRPPVSLALEGGSRNWEGVARFEGGLLLVTDKFPDTRLGWVPLED